MRGVYSVSQVNAYIKNMFTQDFMLNRISIKGEVSNCKYHTSGHIYFSLKDASGTIACVMFAGQRSGLSFRLQDGCQVVVLGSVSVYERDGRYQCYAREIILDGAGLLYERFERLKRELEEMGLFAEEYKQPIPAFARTVGIVTAPTGAAVRDIIQIAARRNPFVRLVLYPALVQGDGAAKSIVHGIEMLDREDVDVIIVGRGGGSIEDLWAFNEESVARAIFECRTPVISAVGHETDTTIADYAADLRAPTPSAAAELAVYEYAAVRRYMDACREKLRGTVLQKVQENRNSAGQLQMRLGYLHPRTKLREQRQLAADLEEQFRRAMSARLEQASHHLAVRTERMKGLSPLERLNRGFSYVERADGKQVRSVRDVRREDELCIRVRDGWISAYVTDTGSLNPVCGAACDSEGEGR